MYALDVRLCFIDCFVLAIFKNVLAHNQPHTYHSPRYSLLMQIVKVDALCVPNARQGDSISNVSLVYDPTGVRFHDFPLWK